MLNHIGDIRYHFLRRKLVTFTRHRFPKRLYVRVGAGLCLLYSKLNFTAHSIHAHPVISGDLP